VKIGAIGARPRKQIAIRFRLRHPGALSRAPAWGAPLRAILKCHAGGDIVWPLAANVFRL
jgi:hypothetical protein